MTQVLELIFELADGKALTISVQNPKSSLTDVEVNHAMQSIISSNVFVRDGQAIRAKKSARIVERAVTEFDMN
ncbi:DUF2922 domain-containing protein [Lysinibacillus sp. KU-BSD001]|uniref:DUF2922 domain-containing protein n=1 Tax=Lysinibacillus sp. KU-BSD001 TaxID=3141328 RepID=UPI0036E19646